MSEKVALELEANSHYRVAYDLALRIWYSEGQKEQDRGYWLKLYSQCHRVVYRGASPEKVLQGTSEF